VVARCYSESFMVTVFNSLAQVGGIATAILALSFLIVVHEAGHYFVARWCSMRVERFSIGFGPAILKRRGKKSGTLFQLAPILFGGFVEIRGMNIAEEVDPDDKHAYANRPARLRFLTILAGPATNWLSAIVLALILYSVYGVKTQERWFGVGGFNKDAASAGLLVHDDRVLAIDGTPVYLVPPSGVPTPDSLRKIISAKQGRPVTVTVVRDGIRRDVTITPKPGTTADGKPMMDAGKQVYLLGFSIAEQFDRVRVGIVSTIGRALRYPVDQTVAITTGIYQIFTGKAKADVGGPVRIVDEFKTAFASGFVYGLELVMLLSVYLALVNLFPLPALDGGRLVFLGYEMITRRRPNPKIEATIHMVGVALLFVVMVLVTYGDVARRL
jgi:regulator of sigma E protease